MIREKTAGTHRAAILRKHHVESVADVVRFATRIGIANP
jgi:hypothetical protein